MALIKAPNGVNPIQGSRLIFLLVAKEEAVAFASAKSPCQEKNRKFFICIQSLIEIRIRCRGAASILRLESMVGSHDSSFCYFQRWISSSIKTVPGIVDLPFEFVPAFQMTFPANHYFKPAALFYTRTDIFQRKLLLEECPHK